MTRLFSFLSPGKRRPGLCGHERPCCGADWPALPSHEGCACHPQDAAPGQPQGHTTSQGEVFSKMVYSQFEIYAWFSAR